VDFLTGIAPLEELELEDQRVMVRADLDVLVDADTGGVSMTLPFGLPWQPSSTSSAGAGAS